jgi:hypothetical protein
MAYAILRSNDPTATPAAIIIAPPTRLLRNLKKYDINSSRSELSDKKRNINLYFPGT